MVDGGDEYAQNNKRGPLRVHRSYSNLKNKTNRQSHEEHRSRNDVGIDHRKFWIWWLWLLWFSFCLLCIGEQA